MFTFRKRSGGNKYTFIVILMILGMVYIFGRISPEKEVAYPDLVHYGSLKYNYVETVKGSPFMFTRSRPAGKEGYLLLSRRGISTSEEIYIYEGNLRYRRYVAVE